MLEGPSVMPFGLGGLVNQLVNESNPSEQAEPFMRIGKLRGTDTFGRAFDDMQNNIKIDNLSDKVENKLNSLDMKLDNLQNKERDEQDEIKQLKFVESLDKSKINELEKNLNKDELKIKSENKAINSLLAFRN